MLSLGFSFNIDWLGRLTDNEVVVGIGNSIVFDFSLWVEGVVSVEHGQNDGDKVHFLRLHKSDVQKETSQQQVEHRNSFICTVTFCKC